MKNLALTTFAIAAVLLISGLGVAESLAAPHSQRALTQLGYRVLVEPEIVEDSGGMLVTRALTWKLRAVFVDADGRLILARATRVGKRGKRKVIKDRTVDVRRPWRVADYARQSWIFRDFGRARWRFDGLRESADIRELPDHDDRATAPAPGHLTPPPAEVKPPERPKPRRKGCADVLLTQGHHPSHLKKCQGVEERCAVTLLKQGHHPSHLNACKLDLPPRCTLAVLRRGFHPNQLDNCAGVDALCAATLLKNGHHPNHLDNCRR